MTVGGHGVVLALQEFRLLELMMANADHVVPSTAILTTLWGTSSPVTPARSPCTCCGCARSSTGGTARAHLRTVRGIGYVFDTIPDADAG